MRNERKKKEPSYDNYRLQSIIKWFKYEPFSTINNLEQYIDMYPEDVVAYIYYSQVLIDINDFELAEKVLKYIDDNYPNENDARILFNKFRILCLKEQYEEAKLFYDQYKYELFAIDPKVDLFEVVYKTKTENNLKREDMPNRYLYNQLIEYKEEDFLDHIKKHLADYNMDLEYPNPVIFSPDFPLEVVLKEIKNIIPNDIGTNFSFYNNFYVFKYDNAGRINNKAVNYFRVITLNGTNKLITMYPLECGENLPYIDLNYLNSIYQKPRVKVRNRIDEFHNRYSKNVK